MAMNKKKTTTAIVAGVTAVALLLGGTFAWTSISQRALNEAAGIVNVGGRLHDDFDGTNKDVYVENFTDPLNGGQPIYARIRLDEYMEVGSEAGKYDAESNSYVADRKAKPVVDGTDIADVNTWTTHVPTTACTVCATSASCAIHDHWKWTMGNTEAKYFMPTFNKDKDSLDADVNGTYHGKDDTDKVYYDDYVVYEKDQTVTKDAYYDDDTDTRPNVHEPLAGAIAKQETHTAKLTGTATVITMAEFLDPNGNNGAPGNFWVYDTDGWAYWANPIMPGESTGFLLDSIKMEKNPGEKCYYAINVVAQFATVGDWEYFTDKDGKFDVEKDSDAMKLLDAASKAVPTVTVTNVSGATTVEAGQQYGFTASVSKGATANASIEENGFEWTVYDENMVESETSTVTKNAEGGVTLNVGANERSNALIIAARCTDAEYLGATGLASVAVNVIPIFDVAIDNSSSAQVFPGYLSNSDTFQMVFIKNGQPVTEGISWEMKLLDGGTQADDKELEGTEINSNGLITVSSNEVSFTQGNYDYETYHIIQVTGTDSEGNSVSRNFLICNSGIRTEVLEFTDSETNEVVDSSYLVKDRTYNVRVGIQECATNTYVTKYLDEITVDGIKFTITEDDEDTTAAQIVNRQFVATEVGSYYITGSDDNSINIYQYVTVSLPITFDGKVYSSGSTAPAFVSTTLNNVTFNGVKAKNEFTLSSAVAVNEWTLNETVDGVTLTPNGDSATLTLEKNSTVDYISVTASLAGGDSVTLTVKVQYELHYTICGGNKPDWSRAEYGNPALRLLVDGKEISDVEWHGVTSEGIEMEVKYNYNNDLDMVDLENTENGTYYLTAEYNGATYVGGVLTITD